MKRLISALLVTLMLASGTTVSALTTAEAQSKIWTSYHAAFNALKAYDYDKTQTELQNFITYASHLEQYDGQSHWENIKSLSAIKNHLSLSPQLYVEASSPADAKYFGAKHEPEYGAFFGKCDSFAEGKETAYLLYVQFGKETISSFEYLIPKKDDLYLEIAWNLPNENKADLDKVASGSMDSYIMSNLKYVGKLKQKVLLRFGAEVNCWSLPAPGPELDAYIESYKKAFQRVAEFARRYAPNAAMVYSPNDISNWYVTAEDFYPGDEYVDWVGISMYSNINESAKYDTASDYDAYYCLGYYDSPIAKIKNIVDAFGDKKPIMISECGFSYKDSAGIQTEAHAVEKLQEFYSYVTMVYPSVKGVMFFNANSGKNYSLSGSKKLEQAYYNTAASNISFKAMLTGEKKGYTRFETLDEKIDTLNLHVYAEYPTAEKTVVSYTLDGKALAHKGDTTNSLSIAVSTLSHGKHTLAVTVKNGTYTKTKNYDFYVAKGNYVTYKEQIAPGTVIGQYTQTDIVAKIDGQPIRSYNIDGYTVIIAEDLTQYGFNVVWDGKAGTLTVTEGNKKITSTYKPEKAATASGNVIYSDIVTYVNGKAVKSFNIGGMTAIYIDDLAPYGKIAWDGVNKVISFAR